MRYTNIIAMKNIIISEKVREKKLLKGPVNTTALAEIAQPLSPIDFTWRYRWAMRNVEMNAAKKLGLTGVKKYWRRAG